MSVNVLLNCLRTYSTRQAQALAAGTAAEGSVDLHMSASDFDRVRKALEALVYIKSSQHDSNSAENCSLTTVSSASAPAKGAKYRPWDRSDLFRRLRSFTSSKWFCKPECISPLECARRGWLNSKLDRLQCEVSWQALVAQACLHDVL